MGKGSTRRPGEGYEASYDRIFGKVKAEPEQPDNEALHQRFRIEMSFRFKHASDFMREQEDEGDDYEYVWGDVRTAWEEWLANQKLKKD